MDKIAYYHCAKRGGCKSPYVEMADLEGQVEDEFKKLEFTEEFIELVTEKARDILNKQKGSIESRERGVLNKRRAVENKRSVLEDRLLDNTIDRETFKRKHSELQSQIDNFDRQLMKFEQERKLDVDFIEEVLSFSRNIYKTYKDAPKFLKRHYLRFFFEQFFVKNKEIVEVKHSPIFAVLQEERQVILRSNWLRRVDSIRTYYQRNSSIFKSVRAFSIEY